MYSTMPGQRVYLSGELEAVETPQSGRGRGHMIVRLIGDSKRKLETIERTNEGKISPLFGERVKIKLTLAVDEKRANEFGKQLISIRAGVRKYKFRGDKQLFEGWNLQAEEISRERILAAEGKKTHNGGTSGRG